MGSNLPPLVRIDTIWRTPWLISSLLQHGLGHYREGKPIQDALAVGGWADHTWLVVADGVGSQPMSHHGSRRACDAVAQHLLGRLTAGAKADVRLMTEAFDAAHQSLVGAAQAANQPIHVYATTLAAVLISGDTLLAGNIGDSAIVAYTTHLDGDSCKPRLTPLSSASQPPVRAVYAITHPKWREHFTVRESTSPHIKGIVLATDGANSFFLEDGEDNASPFATTFLDAVAPAVTELTPRRFSNFFATYVFQTEADHSDDRTIILAYRLDPKLQPPYARS